MSAGGVVQAALAAALRGDAAFASVAVFDAPPVRAAVPYALVEEPVVADWSAKGLVGREARVTVAIHDAGERPVRLRELMGAVEARATGLSGAIGEGWRVAGAVLLRSRVDRRGERWIGASEFRVRVWRES